MNMYEVRAKCGHVGKGYYIEKTFAIMAQDGKEAAAIARQKPRVKHHHKDAIRFVKQINIDRYREIIRENSNDPYMNSHSIQEQRARCKLEVAREEQRNHAKSKREDEDRELPKYYHKKKLRHPKKYINNYIAFEERIS